MLKKTQNFTFKLSRLFIYYRKLSLKFLSNKLQSCTEPHKLWLGYMWCFAMPEIDSYSYVILTN